MIAKELFEQRRIRYADEYHNGLPYYQGQGSLYPKNGDYLDPNSEYKNRFIDMANWISSTLEGRGNVLDIGGATGNLGYWMKKLFPNINVIHTDYSLEALVFSKKVYKHEPILVDTANLPFIDEVFEGILFADVLEHLNPDNAEKALKSALRILKPKGYVFINIPNRHTWTDKAFQEPSHIWLPTISDMRSVLESLEFKNIKITTRGFPVISKMRKHLRKDLHFPFGGTSILVSAQK